MELNDNGKGISGIAHKADYSGLHDEKVERFAKAFLEFLKSLIDDAGITEEEWKEAFIPWNRFFEPEMFNEIKSEIGPDLEGNKIISVGLYPSIALFNGLYCLDGYSNYYDLEYKHSFGNTTYNWLRKFCKINDFPFRDIHSLRHINHMKTSL